MAIPWWNAIDQNVIPGWSTVDQKVIPRWNTLDQKVTPWSSWSKGHTKMKHTWSKCHTRMKHSWSKGHTKMKHTWSKCHTRMKHSWSKGHTMMKHTWSKGHSMKHSWPKGHTMMKQLIKLGWGCSSAGDHHTNDTGSITWCSTGFLFKSQFFSAGSLSCVHTPPCAITCIHICAHIKDPVVHVRVRWIMETLKHPACNEGWVAQLCCSWLSLGKATRISHVRNPIWTIHMQKVKKKVKVWLAFHDTCHCVWNRLWKKKKLKWTAQGRFLAQCKVILWPTLGLTMGTFDRLGSQPGITSFLYPWSSTTWCKVTYSDAIKALRVTLKISHSCFTTEHRLFWFVGIYIFFAFIL